MIHVICTIAMLTNGYRNVYSLRGVEILGEDKFNSTLYVDLLMPSGEHLVKRVPENDCLYEDLSELGLDKNGEVK